MEKERTPLPPPRPLSEKGKQVVHRLDMALEILRHGGNQQSGEIPILVSPSSTLSSRSRVALPSSRCQTPPVPPREVHSASFLQPPSITPPEVDSPLLLLSTPTSSPSSPHDLKNPPPPRPSIFLSLDVLPFIPGEAQVLPLHPAETPPMGLVLGTALSTQPTIDLDNLDETLHLPFHQELLPFAGRMLGEFEWVAVEGVLQCWSSVIK